VTLRWPTPTIPLRRSFFRGTRAGLALLAASALTGCADLPLLDENTCGNRVLEPGEDCDGQAGCGDTKHPHSCRYLCEGELECPDGFGCGLDQVCRQHGGRFESVFVSSSVTTRDLLVGDINGDGCAELLRATLRGSEVTAFPSRVSDACPAAEQTLQTGRPGSGEQSYPALLLLKLGERAPPVVVAGGSGFLGDGLFVYFAEADPLLTPLLYPSVKLNQPQVRMLPVRVGGADVLLILGQGAPGGPMDAAGTVAVLEDPRRPPAQLGMLPGGLEGLVALRAAELDGAVTSEGKTCEEIVIGRAGDASLYLYRLCESSGGLAFSPLPSAEVELDSQARLRKDNASLAVIDMNGDGHLDLVTNADDSKIHVAYGLGNGQFNSAPPPSPPDGAHDQRTSALAIVAPDPQQPDGYESRLVSPDNIFVAGDFDPAQQGPELVPLVCPVEEMFESPECTESEGPCEAVVTDIDADGRLDIVATEGQQPYLAVHRGLAGGGFHGSLEETRCPPRYLAAADINGDGVTDVTLFDQVARRGQAGAPPGAEEDATFTTLTIAYGNAFAAPTVLEDQGRFDQAAGLAAGRFIVDAPRPQLFAARMLGGESLESASASALAMVEGDSERVLRAPFYFPPEEGSPTSWSLRAIAAGRFASSSEGGEPRPGLIAITENVEPGGSATSPTLWLLQADEGGGGLRALQRVPLEQATCDDCVLVPVRAAAGGSDSVLLLGDHEVLVYEITAAGVGEPLRLASAHAFRSMDERSNPAKHTGRPVVGDLDGDGLEDVIAPSADGALVALWGRADGAFDEAVLITAPGCEGGAACGSLAAAALNADADAARELAVVGPGLLGLHDLDPASRELIPRKLCVDMRGSPSSGETCDELPAPPASPDFSGVGAGDFDGDGVDDLVVMGSSTFFNVLRGKPVLQ